MGILVILGCAAAFAFNSVIGIVCAAPLWIGLALLYRRLKRSGNDSLRSFHRTALVVGLTAAVSGAVYFFSALDLSGLYKGVFACPRLTQELGYYWPAVFALILLVVCLKNPAVRLRS